MFASLKCDSDRISRIKFCPNSKSGIQSKLESGILFAFREHYSVRISRVGLCSNFMSGILFDFRKRNSVRIRRVGFCWNPENEILLELQEVFQSNPQRNPVWILRCILSKTRKKICSNSERDSVQTQKRFQLKSREGPSFESRVELYSNFERHSVRIIRSILLETPEGFCWNPKRHSVGIQREILFKSRAGFC